MAINTANKRASTFAVDVDSLIVLPAPDAFVDTGDRSQVGAQYRLEAVTTVATRRYQNRGSGGSRSAWDF